MEKPRSHLSYANVTATLALFIALGGVSYAAAKIGSDEIANNGIRSKDLRNNDVRGKDIRSSAIAGSDVGTDALTGDDVLESSLGSVPLATNAQQAANASAVGGVRAARIDFRAIDGTQQTEILNLGGLIMRADCNPADSLDIQADTTVAGAYLQSAGMRSGSTGGVENQVQVSGDFDPGDNLDLLPDVDDSTLIQLGYTTPAGSQVTAVFHVEDDQPDANRCLVAGHALQSG